MPEWAVEMMHNHRLSEEKLSTLVDNIIKNDEKFRKETAENSATNEDKLRRYNM